MPSAFSIEFRGFDELATRLGDAASGIVGPPLRRFALAVVLRGERVTKEGMPVDRGRGRNSVNHEIDGGTIPRFAKWGSKLKYMRALESGSVPHWPPKGALQPWASRHGFPAGASGDFLVRRAISQKGTPAHNMFGQGAEAVRRAFPAELAILRQEIARNMSTTEFGA